MTKHEQLDSFVCWYCEKSLSNNRYVVNDGFAVCLTCFEQKYSNHCVQCNEPIGFDVHGSTFQDKHWHNKCFNCFVCNISLIDKKFAYRHDKLYCRACFIIEYADRCHRCNQPLEPGDKCVQYDKKQYHKSCFRCNACQSSLTNEEFSYRDQYFLCTVCRMNIRDIYCIKCHQAIANDGIIYHNHPFHYECFLCTHCGHPLRNQHYIEYNNDAYCSQCSRHLCTKASA